MGNKSSVKERDSDKQYSQTIKSLKPCIHHQAKRSKFAGPKHILIEYDSAVDNLPVLSMKGIIGTQIDETKSGDQIDPTKQDDLYGQRIVLMHIDNRWKGQCQVNQDDSKLDTDTFCCWYLRLKHQSFPSKKKNLGRQYDLHFLQIHDGKTLLITFRLTLLSAESSEFMMSPDSNYLLCFGQGCHFIKLPNIYNDISQYKLWTIQDINRHYKCNKKNVRNLFEFQSFPTISVAHFIDDHRLLYSEYYDRSTGVLPSEQAFSLLDLRQINEQNSASCKSLGIFGHQDQYVTSGYGLVVFSSRKYTKHAPNHLIADQSVGISNPWWIYKAQSVEISNHLWIYKVHGNRATMIGHNYSLKEPIQTQSRTLRENTQIVKREYDGMHKDKYWLIAFVGTITSRQHGVHDIHIFDIPSCTLTWVISGHRFELGLVDRAGLRFIADKRPRYKRFRLYCCSYGIVVFRTLVQQYGASDRRIEADFALHPVPFWDHEQIRKLLQPHVLFVSELVDIIMSYSGSRSVEDQEITSHLRYIPATALTQSDGLGGFVLMAPYWDKQQIEAMSAAFKNGDQSLKKDSKHLILRGSWDQLMMHQYPPSGNSSPFAKGYSSKEKQSVPRNPFDDVLLERGSYLHLVHQLLG